MVPQIDFLWMQIEFCLQKRQIALMLGRQVTFIAMMHDADVNWFKRAIGFMPDAHDSVHGGFMDFTKEANVVTMAPHSIIKVRRPIGLRMHAQAKGHDSLSFCNLLAQRNNVVHDQLFVGVDIQNPLSGDSIESEIA